MRRTSLPSLKTAFDAIGARFATAALLCTSSALEPPSAETHPYPNTDQAGAE
jgi:hypothetical protein